MATLGSVKADVVALLGDQVGLDFTDENLNAAVDAACGDAAKLTGLTEIPVDLDLLAGADSAVLNPDVLEVLAVILR